MGLKEALHEPVVRASSLLPPWFTVPGPELQTRGTSPTTALSRRQFLRHTAIAATALGLPSVVPASALGADGTVAPSGRITLGFVGVGGRGEGLLRAFVGNPQAHVLAVCDAYADRQIRCKQIVDDHYGNDACARSGDYRELLARADIDAVVIAAQDHWHALIATAAAKAGKHLYCEKPLGVTYEESRAIRDAVRQAGIVFQTGTQQRSEGSFRRACELVRNGYVGKLHRVEVGAPGPSYRPSYRGSLDPQPVPAGFDWEGWRGPAPRKPYNPGRVAWPDWYLIWDYCAGFIVNWGVHHLDIALWGCPELAQAPFELECRANYRTEGFTDNASGWRGTFSYASGLQLLYTDDGKQESGCRFVGDEGWIRVDRPGIWAEPEGLLEIQLKPDDRPLHRSTNHGADFLTAVRRRTAPVSDVETGHQATYFGQLADVAARLRRPIKWDPRTETLTESDDAARLLLRRPVQPPWRL
ncbi:MAG: Gfo/Idh/MocA family oxidoreductase [Verrucomicrobiales bacterium]|nr:Gfo/Idh/MocA family oxidoreductase [Verrucomicrobiales bacterium]